MNNSVYSDNLSHLSSAGSGISGGGGGGGCRGGVRNVSTTFSTTYDCSSTIMSQIIKESLMRCFGPLDLLNIAGGLTYLPRNDYLSGGPLIHASLMRVNGRDLLQVKYYKREGSYYFECLYDLSEFGIKSCFE